MFRFSNTSDLLTALSRISRTASSSIGEAQCTRYTTVHQSRTTNPQNIIVRRYPDPPTLSLPTNVSEIFANETGRFTPERARDIAAPVLLYGQRDCKSFSCEQLAKPAERTSNFTNCNDTHVDSYDCFGAVSLNGTMQSNVPKPFSSNGKSTHLNMPGGQWARDGKYIAEDMQKSHYRSMHLPQLSLDLNGLVNILAKSTVVQRIHKPMYTCSMGYSTKIPQSSSNLTNSDDKEKTERAIAYLSKKQRFKKMLKDYGSTVTILYMLVSLISLGTCYAAVVSGVDVKSIINFFFTIENEDLGGLLGYSSKFLIAYTIHKLLLPVRLSITLGITPMLVKVLRKHGLLKPMRKPEMNTKKIQ